MTKQTPRRNEYDALRRYEIAQITLAKIDKLVDGAARADHVDEHGAWEFGAEFDNKGRGVATNWDIYGYGQDLHTRRFLAVIQVRRWEKTRRNGFANVRKSYFLLGRNEDNSVFAHCVSPNVVRAAIRKDSHPCSAVRASQDWIFGTDYRRVQRQGDMALIKARDSQIKGHDKQGAGSIVLEDSHRLDYDALVENGALYAYNPTLRHLPNTHPTIQANGWAKVIVGNRKPHHDFAAATVD